MNAVTDWCQNSYDWLEKKLGSLKFAVIIISIFTLMMVIGTFLESYYGTEFANRILYKRAPFMLVQFFMGLSILFAAFRRLPPKKRLYGFYVIHTGLVLLGVGSFITWYSGVDGSILLRPNDPSRHVILSEDVLTIQFPFEGKKVETELPYVALPTNINSEYENIKIKRFLPYAEKELIWKPSSELEKNAGYSSATYYLANPNVAETFTLSLHPRATEFETSMQLGPLRIHYLPKALAPCFDQTGSSRLILWNADGLDCFTPENRGISIQETKSKTRFFVLEHEGKLYSFFPDHSPFPIDVNENRPMTNSPFRVFNQKIFQDNPHLFLFGESTGHYDQDEERWVVQQFRGKDKLPLPWMGFEIERLAHHLDTYPDYEPRETHPIQKNGELIQGNLRALEVEIDGKSFWVTNERSLDLMVGPRKLQMYIGKKTLQLPFEFVLTKFKMDKDPGTQSPASYESFVKVFTNDGPVDSHIFMNNPLKMDGFTFYQASYSQDPQSGQYASTLSANVDQGRPIKYLGSIFLVLGSIWHYRLNRKKKLKKASKPLLDSFKDNQGEGEKA